MWEKYSEARETFLGSLSLIVIGSCLIYFDVISNRTFWEWQKISFVDCDNANSFLLISEKDPYMRAYKYSLSKSKDLPTYENYHKVTYSVSLSYSSSDDYSIKWRYRDGGWLYSLNRTNGKLTIFGSDEESAVIRQIQCSVLEEGQKEFFLRAQAEWRKSSKIEAFGKPKF